MEREEAIRILNPETAVEALAEIEYYNGFNGKAAMEQAVNEACAIAVADMQERERRERGCEYCQGEKALYQHTHTTKLYVDTFGRARILLTECVACPPYANCSVRNIPVRSAFTIKYCPECGRKLTEPPKRERRDDYE